MVGGSSSLRRGAVPSYRRRSWSLGRRVRAAQRETAQLVTPAITAVKARLPRCGRPSWNSLFYKNSEAPTAVPQRSAKTKKPNPGFMRKRRSPSRSPSRISSGRLAKSWSHIETSNTKLKQWAQRSRTELTSISKRFRKLPPAANKNEEQQTQFSQRTSVTDQNVTSAEASVEISDVGSIHEENVDESTSSVSEDESQRTGKTCISSTKNTRKLSDKVVPQSSQKVNTVPI